MLIISRRPTQTLVIDDRVTVTVMGVDVSRAEPRVRIGIDAPPEVQIFRGELLESPEGDQAPPQPSAPVVHQPARPPRPGAPVLEEPEKPPRCVHCQSDSVYRHGRYRGRRRFLCRDCGRVTNELSSTPVARTIYPERWVDFLWCVCQGMTVRQTAADLDISVPTVIDWRRKLVAFLRQIDATSAVEEREVAAHSTTGFSVSHNA